MNIKKIADSIVFFYERILIKLGGLGEHKTCLQFFHFDPRLYGLSSPNDRLICNYYNLFFQ